MERIDFWFEIPTYCWILYKADEVRLLLVKNQCWSQSFDSKASWRKEIKLLLSVKYLFLSQPV